MTATMNYEVLRSRGLSLALKKLSSHPFQDIKTGYNVSKVCQALQKELKLSQELWVKLINEYTTKDVKGEIIVGEKGEQEILKERRPDFEKKMEEFYKNEITFDKWFPLKLSKLIGVTFTAEELSALDSVLEIDIDLSEEASDN
jgi:hypothetical protein